jgi:hypothetical protein
MQGAILMVVAIAITGGVCAWLVGAMIKSIQVERRRSRIQNIWHNFGLSIGFCILFFVTWVGQGIVQWQEFTDEQKAHNQPVELGDFVAAFGKSTLENWQSEFLQLFSFTVMTALLIHHGSAESKDSDDRIEESLRRIERKLGVE